MTHPERIDASSIWPALNPEEVTPGQVESLREAADFVLDTQGVESHINGLPATVSKHYIEAAVGDEVFYARVYRDKSGRTGIAFDNTTDISITTNNPNALFFDNLQGGMSLRADNASLSEVDVDNPKHVALATKIIGTLVTSGQKELELKAEAEARKIQQDKYEKELAAARRAESKVYRRRTRREKFIRVARAGGMTLGITAVASGIVGGGMYMIDSAKDASVSFDELDPAPVIETEGSIVSEGESASPAFAQELIDMPVFQGVDSDVPDLVKYLSSAGTLDRDEIEPLTISHSYREVHIISSKTEKDMNCTTFEVKAPDNTALLSWTDFRNPEELTVTFEDGTGKVCWNGNERDIEDDPRIVLTIQENTTANQD